jgi:hypothetical protein
MAIRLAKDRMIDSPVFARIAPICERTVEIATPSSLAASSALEPLQSATRTRFSALVKPWLRANAATDRDSQMVRLPRTTSIQAPATGVRVTTTTISRAKRLNVARAVRRPQAHKHQRMLILERRLCCLIDVDHFTVLLYQQETIGRDAAPARCDAGCAAAAHRLTTRQRGAPTASAADRRSPARKPNAASRTHATRPHAPSPRAHRATGGRGRSE